MNVSVVATMGNTDGVFEAFKACTESENYLTVRILKHTVRMLLENMTIMCTQDPLV